MIYEDDEICGSAPDGTGSQADLLPEFIQYRDEGCKQAASCLDCPLPHCIYDRRRKQKQPDVRRRDKEIEALRRSGKTVKQLSRRFKVSQRTIARILRGVKRKQLKNHEGESSYE